MWVPNLKSELGLNYWNPL